MALDQHIPDEPLANLLFEFRGADLILRSHDSRHFRVPKSYIVNSSSVLEELIQRALNSPDAAHGEASLPVVQLPETGAVLHKLLTFIFPVTPVSPSTTEETMELLSVANQYKMVSTLVHIRNSISTEGTLQYLPRDSTLNVYSLAQTYGLHPEALQAAEGLLMNFSMDIEDLDDKLDMMPGHSLYELWKHHKSARAILAANLEEFRKSGARATLTDLRCTKSSPSPIPHWLDIYIESIGKDPKLLNLDEFFIALVRHLSDGSERNGCACAGITTQTIRKFRRALLSVRSTSLIKAQSALSLVQEQEDSRVHVKSTTSLPKPLDIPDANLIIRSSDLVNFRVHKSVVAMASPFFRDLLSLAQLSPSQSIDGLPVVQLREDAELLKGLVSLLYPIRPKTPKSYDKALNLLAACKKYDMVRAMSVVRTRISWGRFPQAQGTEVFGVYAIASSNGLILEMKEAAHGTLDKPLTVETLWNELPWFKGSALRDLVLFRKRCRDSCLTCLESFLEVHPPGPSSIWVGCTDVMPKRSLSDPPPPPVLPSWLRQFLSQIISDLKLRAFTDPLDFYKNIRNTRLADFKSHAGCDFCSRVETTKGFYFFGDLSDRLEDAQAKVHIQFQCTQGFASPPES